MNLRLAAAVAALLTAPSFAAVSFVREVAPVLVKQCVECHRADKAKGRYRLDHFEALLKPGDSGAKPVTPGKPEASELLRLIVTHDEDERMPQKGDALPKAQQEMIRQWIAEGAKFDAADRKAALATLLPEAPRPKAPEKYPRPLPVTALAASADGARLAVSGYHEVTVWDLKTGRLSGRIGNMPEKVNALAWSGSLLVVGGGTPLRSGEVWLVDTAKKNAARRLFTTKDTVMAVACTKDGKLLFAGGADNRLRAFSLPEGKPLWNVEPHADWIMALAASPDGKHLATASRDRTARLFDATSGRIEATHTGHAAAVTSVIFKPDGEEVLSGDAEGKIRRWKLDGNGDSGTTLRPGRTDVLGIGFYEAETVTALANGMVGSLDLKSRKVKDKLAQHQDRVNALVVAATPDGPRIVSGSHDGEVRVYDVKLKKEILKFTASPGLDGVVIKSHEHEENRTGGGTGRE